MTKPAESPSRLHLHDFDIRDGALVVGVISIIGGIAHYSFAVASVVFGVMCLAIALFPAPAQVKRPERQS